VHRDSSQPFQLFQLFPEKYSERIQENSSILENSSWLAMRSLQNSASDKEYAVFYYGEKSLSRKKILKFFY